MKDVPDYRRIYSDMITMKYPEKLKDCFSILEKDKLTTLDIIEINQLIFGKHDTNNKFNQQHKSYKKSDILKILEYQKKNNYNNSQVANHFKLSRNSIIKWKKKYIV